MTSHRNTAYHPDVIPFDNQPPEPELWLEQPKPAHRPEFVAVYSQNIALAEAAGMAAPGLAPTLQQNALMAFRARLAAVRNGDDWTYAIRAKRFGIVGEANAFLAPDGVRMSIWVAARHQRRGIGVGAAAALGGTVFGDPEVSSISALIQPDYLAAIALARKLGAERQPQVTSTGYTMWRVNRG